MKYWQALIVYVVAFLLQPFLHNLIPFFGSNVNLVLCVSVMLVFLYQDNYIAIVFAMIFGLLGDIVYGMYAGPGAFAITVTCIAVLLLREFANIENILNALVTMILGTWLYASVYWVVYSFIGSPYSYIYAMKSLPWQLLFNCIVAALIYLVLIRKIIKHRRDRYFR